MPAEKRIMPVQDFGYGFSRFEAQHIVIGIAVMTVAFALAYIGGGWSLLFYFRIGGANLVLLIFGGSFVAVVTAFFAHELAHKAVAQRYGAIAEFRTSPMGLLAGLTTAYFGVMLAFPGVVVITGTVSDKQNGRISAAGPATNLAFAAIFIWLSLQLGTAPGRYREPVPIFIGAIAFVNVLLAMFNLIPVPAINFRRKVAGRFPVKVALPPNDGYLILVANKATWAAFVVVLVALGVGGRQLNVF